MTTFRYSCITIAGLCLIGCAPDRSEKDAARIAELEAEVASLRADPPESYSSQLMSRSSEAQQVETLPEHDFGREAEEIRQRAEMDRLQAENERLERERLNRETEDMFNQ